MKLSVACNFDEELLPAIKDFPVYEIYGKLTQDFLGGGRPSFYLPEVNEKKLQSFVELTHQHGIEFNYLLNSSAMDNIEFTRDGQRKLDQLLEWLDEIAVDSVTVANPFLLRLVKKRHPRIKVRVSSHRYTDNPRKVRFWVEQGADVIVVSEVNIHREFKVLESMQEAAEGTELQLIVNNWCRQDCAIASNHAVGLSAASRSDSKGFPLDYCSLVCNQIRLKEPVNYLRANWIRPEDLPHYEALGFHNFKIVERNTPTPLLALRSKAYSERRYDGNLMDLIQNYSYPEEAYGDRAKDAYSLRRMMKYFVRPRTVNLFKFPKVIEFGKTGSVLYPRRGENPVQIDNRSLDGFIDRFLTKGCQDLDCEKCGYCHRWAEKTVKIDPQWAQQMEGIYEDLLDELDRGSFWEPYAQTLVNLAKNPVSLVDMAKKVAHRPNGSAN